MGIKRIGVTCLEEIRQRCRIDDITGCWNWGGGMSDGGYTRTPVAHIGEGILPAEHWARAMPAYRAAWLLAGKPLKKGQVVYRAVCCNTDCINPKHCAAGSMAEMHKAYSLSGKNKGKAHRILINTKSRIKMMMSRERVLEVERRLSAGQTYKQIRADLKIDGASIRKIRDGLHPNCSIAGQSFVVAQSSVFTWARAA